MRYNPGDDLDIMAHQDVYNRMKQLMNRILIVPGSDSNRATHWDLTNDSYRHEAHGVVWTSHGLKFDVMTPAPEGLYLGYDMRQRDLHPAIIYMTPADIPYRLSVMPSESRELSHADFNFFMTWRINGFPLTPSSKWAIDFVDIAQRNAGLYKKVCGYDMRQSIGRDSQRAAVWIFPITTTSGDTLIEDDFIRTRPEASVEAVCYD